MADLPQEHRLRANGVELACFEWHRELRGRQSPILLVHHGSYEGYPGAFPFWRRTRARIIHTASARRATRSWSAM